MYKLLLLFFILYFQHFPSQESKNNYYKYENAIYSFELPSDIWGIPDQKLIENFRTNEKKISEDNEITYTEFDFLISRKNILDFSQLFTPLIKVTNGKADKNSFERMKKEFNTNYIEKVFTIEDRESLYSLRPIVDSKKRTIILTTHSEGVFGFSKIFFSDNNVAQFTYTDFENSQCIECLIVYINSLDKTFKFK